MVLFAGRRPLGPFRCLSGLPRDVWALFSPLSRGPPRSSLFPFTPFHRSEALGSLHGFSGFSGGRGVGSRFCRDFRAHATDWADTRRNQSPRPYGGLCQASGSDLAWSPRCAPNSGDAWFVRWASPSGAVSLPLRASPGPLGAQIAALQRTKSTVETKFDSISLL